MLRTLQWLLAKEPLLRALKPLSGPFNPLLPEHRQNPHRRSLKQNASLERNLHSHACAIHCQDVALRNIWVKVTRNIVLVGTQVTEKSHFT